MISQRRIVVVHAFRAATACVGGRLEAAPPTIRYTDDKAPRARYAVLPGTRKGQVRNILSKLGAIDRTHAAVLGIKRGIIA